MLILTNRTIFFELWEQRSFIEIDGLTKLKCFRLIKRCYTVPTNLDETYEESHQKLGFMLKNAYDHNSLMTAQNNLQNTYLMILSILERVNIKTKKKESDFKLYLDLYNKLPLYEKLQKCSDVYDHMLECWPKNHEVYKRLCTLKSYINILIAKTKKTI